MTLHQLSQLKQWHTAHRAQAPLEYHAWDAVLTLWLMGWMGLPAALLLGQGWQLLACTALCFAPGVYCTLRRTLHTQIKLRCDWLAAAGQKRAL